MTLPPNEWEEPEEEITQVSQVDDIFAESDKGIEAWKLESAAAHEDSVARYMMGKLGFASRARQLRVQAGGQLALRQICEELHGWPVYLGYHFVPYAYKVLIPKLFGGFTKTKLYEAYALLRQTCPDHWLDRPCGIVFHMKDIPGMRSAMVFHDGITPVSDGRAGFWVRINNIVYNIERLDDMMTRLASSIELRVRDYSD